MKRILVAVLSLLISLSSLPGFTQGNKTYTQPELDRMLAPIALYPDPLLSQILMAATYPIEVVEAARWTRANPGLQGDAAVQAVQHEDWDPSVKSLVAFPQVLQRMDENLDWTRSLGDAFLGQQPHVMDTVQQLRRRAHAAGNLRSSEHLQVEQQGELYYVQPVNPQVVYVPYYNPLVVYGPWWWPAYQPVVWAPWPGYVRVARPGISVTFWWGAPVAVSAGFFFGRPDWHRRHVHVHHVHHVHHHRHRHESPRVWQHDPHHRRGVAYRDAAVRQQVQQQGQAQPQQKPQAQPQARPQRREQEREKRRDERRHERPVARDLQDSKVLTPAPRTEARPQAQPQPRPQAQVRERPKQQVQERPRPAQQEERRQVREERREQRQEARQERREQRPAPQQRQERREEARQGNGRGG
jgi:hypothetical protein